ncbi:MAG: class I SAM-dependent methyltransferase [Candidatus Edwardsbacteria bacterium]
MKQRERILKLYDNPLRKLDHVVEKDLLEAEFYNHKAEEFLTNFDESQLLYNRPDEQTSRHTYFYSLLDNIQDKQVLDCCCGNGADSIIYAKSGAIVHGIDISEKMLEIAKINTRVNKVLDKVRLYLMSVQQMAFRDAQFDIVVGRGALHHLQLQLAGKEISRVLKKGGKAIFLEPLANSRLLLIWIRSLIPVECFESPGGGPLTYRDIKYLSRFFRNTYFKEFYLFSKLLRFKIFKRFQKKLERLDEQLFKNFPFMRKYAGAVVIQFIC